MTGFHFSLFSTPKPENRYLHGRTGLWEIWQDFGVVGTPTTDSAGSIRV